MLFSYSINGTHYCCSMIFQIHASLPPKEVSLNEANFPKVAKAGYTLTFFFSLGTQLRRGSSLIYLLETCISASILTSSVSVHRLRLYSSGSFAFNASNFGLRKIVAKFCHYLKAVEWSFLSILVFYHYKRVTVVWCQHTGLHIAFYFEKYCPREAETQILFRILGNFARKSTIVRRVWTLQ